jgi:hypothetical protein
MTNIKLAGRLSLAYDVLSQALAACPPELLTDSLKQALSTHPGDTRSVEKSWYS